MIQTIIDHKIAFIAGGVAVIAGGCGLLLKKFKPETYERITNSMTNVVDKGKEKVLLMGSGKTPQEAPEKA
jgi:hypothetical protein